MRRWLRRRLRLPALPTEGATGIEPASAAFGSLADWQAAAALPAVQAQHRIATQVGYATGVEGWPGWCQLCREPVVFALPSAAAGQAANLREEMSCPRCRLIARNRAAFALLLDGLDLDSADVYLTEQASLAFVWLQAQCPGLQGSEYGLDETTHARLQGWYASLGGQGAIHERDVTRLDFADASLDAIGSFDVLEHVPDYPAALREFARCLRPGGRLVLTAPFIESAQDSLLRARLRADGSVEHLLEPEIHGDPVSGGVLCFHHFGWDLLDACRGAGFRRANWVRTWSPREGLFGLWTLVAHR
ncbi:MAG: class I SAM-dependent methyltransferase [Rhizobium sp.]|nr:class I SAM-dependent methyltransferase [Rhizobium sp.]